MYRTTRAHRTPAVEERPDLASARAGPSPAERWDTWTVPDPAVEKSRELIEYLFGPAPEREFAVRYSDGSVESPPSSAAARFTLVLRRPGALRGARVLPTERSVGEAYVRGDLDIEGDIEEAGGLLRVIRERLRSPSAVLHFLALLRALPPGDVVDPRGARGHAGRWRGGLKHSRRRDAAAIQYHYDVGNDFYRLFLDERMVYSCAYFREGTDDLDTAQEAKLEHICRKLRLRPGERLLDVGCGWGGLIRYAAERYSVGAVGITLSEPQAQLARDRIAAAGLAGRCSVEVRDYRDLPPDTRFDKVASVGMVEHVGRSRLPTYFREAYRLLKPGGLFLNHGIVSLEPAPSRLRRLADRSLRRSSSFIERYVFPDGELVTPGETLKAAEAAGFEVRDVESLREHYSLTLRHWVRRLEAREAEAVALADRATYRIWRLYMAGSAHAFTSGRIGVVQTLLGKPRVDGSLPLPSTRRDLYLR